MCEEHDCCYQLGLVECELAIIIVLLSAFLLCFCFDDDKCKCKEDCKHCTDHKDKDNCDNDVKW